MNEQPDNPGGATRDNNGRPAVADHKAVPPDAPSPEPEHDPLSSRRPRKTTVAIVAALIIGIAGGLAGGWYWRGHDAHEHTAAAGGVGAKKQLWTCGMHPQVIQDKPGNCPICGMALEPMKDDGSLAGTGAATPQERKVKYWWDPMMNPPYISERPGKSPMGMDLVPVFEDEVSGGTAVQIDPVIVQNMGVRVAPVARGPVRRTVRAVGYLDWAQPNIHDVNLRVSGWVEKLHADVEGMHVKRGQPLFDLYSPELQVAVEELITARRTYGSGDGADQDRGVSQTLYDTARRKLEQWGLDAGQIDKLAKLDTAPRTVTFVSPVTGDLTEKTLVEGAAAMMGQRALRIVDRSALWLDAQVYAMDLPFIKLGQRATATIEGLPSREFTGQVVFVDPRVDPTTRTAKVRVALPNADLSLRPGMFATVLITAQLLDDAMLAPREAIIETGTRRVVFVALGDGHFEPRKVKLGPASDDGTVQVLAGLSPTDTVVVSGQFLLDAESRMKEAIQKHLRDKLLREGGAPGPGAVAATGQEGHAASAPTASPAQGRAAAATTHGSPAWRAAVDAVVEEYLKLSAAFGRVQQDDRPRDFGPLVAAAGELTRAAADEGQRQLARGVLSATEPLASAGRSLGEQREAFKGVSAAVIALVEKSPPSRAVAGQDGKLFVLYCSMADGQWLQNTGEKANPYYARGMKTCAELKGTIEAAEAAAH